MDLNQTFSALENEKDCLFISDLSEEVDLPMITRTFSYGEKFNEVDEDGTIISKNNLQTAGSPRFDKTQDSTKTDEIIPSSPVFSSSSRRGLRKHQKIRNRKSQDIISLPKPLFSDSFELTSSHVTDIDTKTPPNRRIPSLDSTFQDIDLSDLGGHDDEITPGKRIAASLGCDQDSGSLSWSASLETPAPDPGDTTAERRELPRGEGMKKRLSPRTLFSEAAGDPGVISINREDLIEMESEEEEEDTGKAQNCVDVSDIKNIPSIENQPFVGFKTVGGREIKISDEALAKAKFIMQKITSNEEKMISLNFHKDQTIGLEAEKLATTLEVDVTKPSTVFQTGYGKTVSVSETALLEARNQLSHCPKSSKLTNETKKESPKYVGFKTAKGSNVDISEEAILKARAKFGNDSNYDIKTESANNQENEMFVGFQTAKGSTIQISRSAMEEAKEKIGVLTKLDNNARSNHCDQLVGFKTAKGSDVTISEDALQKAKQKFSLDRDHPAPTVSGFLTAKGSKILISDEAIKKAKERIGSQVSNKISKIPGKPPFHGFQSAKGSMIKISDEALAKARSIMETPGPLRNDAPVQPKTNATGVTGFSTAGGGRISISSEALRKTKNMFQDESWSSLKKTGCPQTTENAPVHHQGDEFDSEDDKLLLEACSIPDTSNVEARGRDLYTCQPSDTNFKMSPYRCGPDFMDNISAEVNGFNVPTSKSSDASKEINLDVIFGKKRKFQEIEVLDGNLNVTFRRDSARRKQKILIEGKKNKQIRPIPGRLIDKKAIDGQKRTKLNDLHIDWSEVEHAAANLSWESAENFIFAGSNYFSKESVQNNITGMSLGDGVLAILSDDGCLGVEELQSAFFASPGVDPKLVPEGWFRNHYRWIVWTLFSYQKRFSDKQIHLTPQNVMSRMKYRYDREIDRSERSVIRRVMEQDESAAVAMVLCVTRISGDKMTLSDGWYQLNSPLYQGSLMQRIVASGKIRVGSKLITQGAEIIGCQAGTPCHPLDEGALDKRELRLYPNSTRRAPWWTRLGRWSTGPVTVRLSSVRDGGGLVSSLRLTVARVYPLLYWVRPAGSGRPRWWSQRDWERSQRKGGGDSVEELYGKVERELVEEDSRQKPRRVNAAQIKNVQCGEELYTIFRDNFDSSLYRCLSDHQIRLLENAKISKADEFRRRVKEEVENRVKKNHCDSSQVLKLRVVNGDDWNISGLLTIWRPGDSWGEVAEGHVVHMSSVMLGRVAGHTVHLNTSKQTSCRLVQPDLAPTNRRITPLSEVSLSGFKPLFNEVDLVVVVLSISPSRDKLSVAVTDSSLGLANITVWAGESERRDLGVVTVLSQPGVVASCKNLEWRGERGQVAALHYTDTSIVTVNTRDKIHQAEMEKLSCLVNKNKERFICESLVRFTRPQMKVTRCDTSPPTPKLNETITRTSWTSSTCDMKSTNVSNKLQLLDIDIAKNQNQLEKQGINMSSINMSSPSPNIKISHKSSKAVTTPFKPPKPSNSIKEVSSQEFNSEDLEKAAVEFMDEMNY